jgi:hypothetical protein
MIFLLFYKHEFNESDFNFNENLSISILEI